jgi:hypothetical protein
LDLQERAAALAAKTGREVETIDQRAFDLSFLDEKGGFFRASATGGSLLDHKLPLSSLSVKVHPDLKVRLTNPTIGLITEDYRRPIKAALNDAYKILGKHSFRVSIAEAVWQTSVYRWVPDQALQSMLQTWGANARALASSKEALIADYATVIGKVFADVRRLAEDNATRAGMSVEQTTQFVNQATADVACNIPSAEAIRSKISVELRPSIMVLGSEMQDELVAQAKSRAALQIEQDRVRAVADDISREAQAASARRRMQKDELARQLNSAENPMKEMAGQFKARIYETAKDLEESIKKNGYMHGSSVRAARNLADYFSLMGGVFDDTAELKGLIARLQAIADSAKYSSIDVGQTRAVLEKLTTLCYSDALAFLNPAESGAVEL